MRLIYELYRCDDTNTYFGQIEDEAGRVFYKTKGFLNILTAQLKVSSMFKKYQSLGLAVL